MSSRKKSSHSSQHKSHPPPPPKRSSSSKTRDRDSDGGKGGGRSKGGSRSAHGSPKPDGGTSTALVVREKKSGHSDADEPKLRRSRSESKRHEDHYASDSRSRGSGVNNEHDNRKQRRSRSRSKSKSKHSSNSSSAPSSSKRNQDRNRSSHDDGHATKKSSKSKGSSKSNKSSSSGPKSNSRSAGTPDEEAAPPKISNKEAAASFNAKKRLQKFANQAQKAIPAHVRMISGSRDSQTSADVSNVNSQFELPNPAGKAGGACTASLLQVLYDSYEDERDDISWVDVLREMRDILDEKGFEQIPQLTSSRMINVRDPFVITPVDGSFNKKKNTQRAVLIGINYVGQNGELSGCHNDVLNIAEYLQEVQGFSEDNITILMDDGEHKSPTKSSILSAYKKLVKESKEGDVVFCHYSGHGGRVADDNGDEDDGFDETLIPVDFQKSGQIRDDDLLKILVHPMPAGVTMTCLMDCCHSGTVLDLPYKFAADGETEEMEMNELVNFKDALWTGVELAMGAAAGAGLAKAAADVAPEMMILGGGPNAIHENSDTACCVVT